MQTEPQIAFVCRKRLRVKQEKPAHKVQAFRVIKSGNYAALLTSE